MAKNLNIGNSSSPVHVNINEKLMIKSNVVPAISGGTTTMGSTTVPTYVSDGLIVEASDKFAFWKDVSDSTTGVSVDDYLLRTGGTMLGPLALSADPTAAMQATTKNYVDSNFQIRKHLANSSDLNTLLTAGYYSTNYQHNILNTPTNNLSMEWGINVINTRTTGTDNGWTWQMAYPAYGDRIYTRYKDGSGSWTTWRNLLDSKNYKEFTSYIPLDVICDTNIRTWCDTNSNVQKSDSQGDFQVKRFFSGSNEGIYSSSYQLSCVDSHNMIFSVDHGTNWLRILSLDMRSPDIWTITKSGPNWGNWLRVWRQGNSVTSAVWNDYAEYRESNCQEPGYVVFENGDDTLSKTEKRLSHFAGVTSDTWGFAQGETEKAKTPIAVAGRVLVYTYQNRENYKPGMAVCAAPDGTVDIMTEEEERLYPTKIVGTVSCVPTYEEWGGGENADRNPVKVNGRIWIKVR